MAQVQGIIHDFVMLNALDQTNACRTATDTSTEWINRKIAQSRLSNFFAADLEIVMSMRDVCV